MVMEYIIDGFLYGFGGILGVAVGLAIIGLFVVIMYAISKI